MTREILPPFEPLVVVASPAARRGTPSHGMGCHADQQCARVLDDPGKFPVPVRGGPMANEAMRILVVDDEPAMREVIEMRLTEWGYRVILAGSGAEARALAEREHPDAVISDVVLPELSGLELLQSLKAGDRDRPVLLITAYGSIDEAVNAMKLGAHDFLTKPLDYGKLQATLAALAKEIARRGHVRRLEAALERGAGLAGLVGRSAKMREVFRLVEAVAASDAAVIICGESGTGKELVARAVHDLSRRAHGPFIAVNVAAIPE